MLDFECKAEYDVYDLKKLVAVLRGEGGCPWDREQTHESIRRNFLEEAYEVAEAIDEGSPDHLEEELGDVLLQVVFHAGIEEDAGRSDLDKVADRVCKKLIFRHPHIFGDSEVSGTEEVLLRWEELKRREKSQKTTAEVLESVAKSLPSLWRAEKIQKKAEAAGADFSHPLDKLSDTVKAFSHSPDDKSMGALLFAVVNAARKFEIDPEDSLHSACDMFTKGFSGK